MRRGAERSIVPRSVPQDTSGVEGETIVSETKQPTTESLEKKISKIDLSEIGVTASGKGRYKAGTGFGSMVSRSNIIDASKGYKHLTDLMKQYGDRERFWTAVAASQYPDDIKKLAHVQYFPDDLSIDVILGRTPQDKKSTTQIELDKKFVESSEQTYANLQLSYKQAVETLTNYLARKKKDRDLKEILSLAIAADSIGNKMKQYEKLLGSYLQTATSPQANSPG